MRPGAARAAILAAAACLAWPCAAAAESFDAWIAELRAEALAAGISAPTVDAALDGIAPLPRVVELDRRQPEGRMTAREYLERVVPESRVRAARERLRCHRPLLEEVAARYRVQPRFIVALWA